MSVNFQPLTPLRFLERSAAVFPGKLAVVCGDRRLTYRQFADEATRIARALQASGIEPGDRVAYLCPNLAEMLIAHFAVPLAGGVLVAMNTRLSPAEVGYISRHSGAKLLVVAEGLLPSLPGPDDVGDVGEVIVISDRDSDSTGEADGGLPLRAYEEFRGRGSVEPLSWEVDDEQATISINYTSGTTGDPKGVSYTHRGAYLNSLGEVIHSEHSSSSVYLWTLPMFHCNGWCTAWGVTAIGGTHVCLRDVRPDVIWRLIDEEGVTHLNGAPAVMTAIARAPEAHRLDRRLTVTTAGAAPSPTMIAELEALGARVNDVPADGSTIGEIVMRGNDVMKGYFRDPAATELAFSGGWFHSGDLGVMHPDGYVELMDRAKDIVISGGENISTVEVEQTLLSHPAVADVAVIGIVSERWGERPMAFVILAAGQVVDARELIEHVRARIAHFKAPDVIEFVATLPRTSTGKVQKYELRAHLRARTVLETSAIE